MKKIIALILSSLIGCTSLLLIAGCSDRTENDKSEPSVSDDNVEPAGPLYEVYMLSCHQGGIIASIEVSNGDYYVKTEEKVIFNEGTKYPVPTEACFIDCKTFRITDKTKYNGEAFDCTKLSADIKYSVEIALISENIYEQMYGDINDIFLNDPYFKIKKYAGAQYYAFVNDIKDSMPTN